MGGFSVRLWGYDFPAAATKGMEQISPRIAGKGHTCGGNAECSIFIFQVGLQCKLVKEELPSDHRLLWLVTFIPQIPQFIILTK